MKLLYFLACERIITDRDSHHPSYINCLNDISVKASIPFNLTFSLATTWRMPENLRKFDIRFESKRNAKYTKLLESPVELDKFKKFFRINLNLNYKCHYFGAHLFSVLIKENKNWVRKGNIVLEIKELN